MSCTEIQRDLGDFLEGRLRGSAARRVREHLAACPACSSSLAPADRAEILPAVDEVVEPADDLRERFRSRLNSHRGARGTEPWLASPWPVTRLRLPWSRQLASLAVLAALLVCGIYFGLYRSAAPGSAWTPADMTIAEDLPLLQDLDVIRNLDLLEEFDEIEQLATADSGPSR
jgi:anti-sigma factor RsiW